MASNNNRKGKNIKNVPDNFSSDRGTPKKASGSPKKESFFAAMLPYILMLSALILAICFVTVRLLGMDDGAGIIGYGIQWFFCGLLGPAAFMLPAAVFYIGLRKCIYNVKWSNSRRTETAENNRASDRRAFILATVMGLLIVTFVSTIFGVNGDEYSGFDVVGMWEDAAEDLSGGGLIGGALGMLLVACFEKLISNILLFISILVCALFLSGFTPASLAERIQESIELRRERRAEEDEEALRLAAEAEAEARKHNNRMAMAQMKQTAPVTAKENPNKVVSRKNTVDQEMLDEDDDEMQDDELEFKPLDINKIYATPSNSNNDIFIGTDGKLTQMPTQKSQSEQIKKDENVGEDFGGDPVFDAKEFLGVQSIIDGLHSSNTAKAPQENNVAEAPDAVKVNAKAP